MPIAILIGLQYKINILPGAIIDLYNAYNWCERFGCKSYIITDIDNSNYIGNFNRDNNIDICSFYNNIKSKVVINSSDDMISNITNILSHGIIDNKLIIYYSGHGVNDSMVMPDNKLLRFVSFRDSILNNTDTKVEIFWILDCCNPHGLKLPYKLDNDNKFTLSSTDVEFFEHRILLITSSESNEKSIATKNGSLFSKYLFQILESLDNTNITTITVDKNRNLRRLIGNIRSSIRKMHTGFSQTVSIYSSYIIDPILWMWIGSTSNYDIITNDTLCSLILRINDK
jgi:hypothetical protein